MPEILTIAVSKGRILKESLPLLARMDIVPLEDPETSRKLVLETNRPEIRLIVVRATDVPVYVEYGAADAGIAGKDVLLEYDGDGLYEPVDLGIACCRLMLAGARDRPDTTGRARVATKYVKTTRNYFAELGRQVEIIKLYGSMELAPILRLADLIVDLVDTGGTLKANGLVPLDKIADISSRLVVNKASMKMKQALLKPFVNNLARLVNP
ncbi:MAG: ATP phosphoribosyltransferase [Gammaproteobacteria bacterium]|nr:MAG: ATP phosphoribosyltransferase [Gammaproteobacteria bacterium]